MSIGGGRKSFDSVLIVDDSAVQWQFATALCRDWGIGQVHEASNGQEALAMLDVLAASLALLIIDLEMPTMDGLELLRHLGVQGVRTPIVVASSRERALVRSVENLGTALGLRILGALQKPLTGETLGYRSTHPQDCNGAVAVPWKDTESRNSVSTGHWERAGG